MRKKYKYEDFQKMAEHKGGKLISTKSEFINLTANEAPSSIKLEWWCGNEDHDTWVSRTANILRGNWCPQCFQERNRKWTYKECERLIKSRGIEENGIGGHLITTEKEYNQMKKIPSHRKLKWQSGISGHKPWITRPNDIDQGRWCPTCRKKKPWEYLDCVKLAERRGMVINGIKGHFLTTKEEFDNIKGAIGHTKLKWWCGKKNHLPWEAPPNNIDQGHWCPDCAGNRRYNYRELQKLAKIRGMEENGVKGELLTSKKEFNRLIQNTKPSQVYLKWWCGKKNHSPWEAKSNWIQQGSWCPQCSNGKYETICRWYFEQIFQSSFPTIQLRKIIPHYKGKMHLDGYSIIDINGEQIKLAFEYNGPQHYEFPNPFHKSVNQYERLKRRDSHKKNLCQKAGILLIEFPYTINRNMNKPKKIREYIIKEFQLKSGIKLSKISKIDHRSKIKS